MGNDILKRKKDLKESQSKNADEIRTIRESSRKGKGNGKKDGLNK